jgi:REP element-mobilizing transposase RayT
MTYDPGHHHRRSIRLKGYDYSQPGAYFITLVAQDRACLFGDVVDGVMQMNEFGRIVAESWQWLAAQYEYVTLDAWVVMPNHLHGIIVITDRGGDGGGRGSDGGGRGGPPPAPTANTPTINVPTANAPPDAPTADAPTINVPTTNAPPDAPAADAPTINVPTINAPPDAPTANTPITDAPTASDINALPNADAPAANTPTTPNVAGGALPLLVKRKTVGRLVGAFKTVSTKRINEQRGTPGAQVWQRDFYEHIIRNAAALARIRRYIVENPARWATDPENRGC